MAGTTAVNIDVSQRLGDALLPFAAIVIGLSIVLLMIVFRSIAVPIKATLGYLLSVGAALGAVVAAFQWGWLDPIMGESAGPIVSFLPIFVMGVLFGLAMDYEMFLVSAMREEYVQTGDAARGGDPGLHASSEVVTAAALIMTSVFVAFIPGGSSTIKPIALGLAVGVAVDAFIVRMTLVPAVLMLLGRRAWWLPRWLDRVLPEVDVEGAALHRKIDYEEWAAETGPTARARPRARCSPRAPPRSTSPRRPGAVTRVVVPDGMDERQPRPRRWSAGPAAWAASWSSHGRLLPEQREEVNRLATLVELGRDQRDDAETCERHDPRHGPGGEPRGGAPARARRPHPRPGRRAGRRRRTRLAPHARPRRRRGRAGAGRRGREVVVLPGSTTCCSPRTGSAPSGSPTPSPTAGVAVVLLRPTATSHAPPPSDCRPESVARRTGRASRKRRSP